MRLTAFLVAALALAMPAVAQQTGPHGLTTGYEAAGWEGVGRLDIADKGFCTGALIAPDLVLTAAHCLFDRDTGAAVAPARIAFRAGFRNGQSVASREVRRAMPHPGYVYDPKAGALYSRNDVALLQLDQPIQPAQVRPFETAEEVRPGTQVSVLSYAAGRSEYPSLEELCGVLGREQGVMILTCEVDFGSSGAPIFEVRDGVPRIVSVISAKGELGGSRVALGTSLTEPLAELQAALAEADLVPQARTLASGERGTPGAKFVSVQGDLNW